jgi:acetamidase/formamidase
VATHQFQPQRYYTAIGRYDPALRVAPGDTVVTTTVDASGADASGARVTPGGNPQTGPFAVVGAAPGDTLVVRFDHLTPSRASGFTRTILSRQTLDRPAARQLPPDAQAQWSIDRARGTATLLDPDTTLGRLTVPLSPMLGCFGVAPSRAQALAATALLLRRSRAPRGMLSSRGAAVSTATCGRYGGNMDYRGFREGVTVYLPVSVTDALFFLGDGHAAQGEGEVIGTGIETSFEVQFTVDLIRGKPIRWPRGEDEEYIFTVGNAYPLGTAIRHATTEMRAWLMADYGLDDRAVGLLLGTCVTYDVGNIYDPAYTMVCKVPKLSLAVVAPARRQGDR